MRDEVSPRRRPVSMYGVPLGLGSLGSPSSAAGGETSTPPRLKRLSLVAAREGSSRVSTPRSRRPTPAAAAVGGEDQGVADALRRSPARHAAADSMSSTDTTTSSRASTDSCSAAALSPLLSPTPRRVAARSSISYSPSTWRAPSAARPDAGVEGGGGRGDGAGAGTGATAGSTNGATTGLTLAERHSDLLRTIAMRERRVNELRQELAVQEEALSALRRRWTAIARADAMAEPPAPRRAGTGASRGRRKSTDGVAGVIAQHTTSPTPTTATAQPEPEPAPAAKAAVAPDVSSLWHTIAADADETIQEGKRFWGQLLRTVGAAAGGGVPESGARGGSAGNGTAPNTNAADDKLDLSRILPALGLVPALPGTNARRAPSPASPVGEIPTPADTTAAARKVAGVRLRRAALSPRPRPLTGETVSGDASSSAPDNGLVPPFAQDTRPEQEAAAHGDDAAAPDKGAGAGETGDGGSPLTSPLSPRPPVTAVLDSMSW